MKVRTEYVHPPIPLRSFDWCAYDEDSYDGAEDAGRQPVGWGATEAEARADFMDQWMEREAERDMKAAVRAAKVWDGVFDQLLGKRA